MNQSETDLGIVNESQLLRFGIKGLVPFELNVPLIQKLARKSNAPRLLAAFMNSRSGGEEGRERSSTFFR
jgi:hypothetical protein